VRNQYETSRMDALHQLKLLDTPASESFDRITRMASQIFGLPVAAVSLTDHDRQWFKSRVGVAHRGIPRAGAPCAEVAASAQLLVIEDLRDDPDYADSPLGRAGTRFYAGAPLVTHDGFGLGALCVLGTEPRKATPAELAALTDLAAMVMAQIELQHAFGRIDPISGMPTRHQFREDLMDLARDQAGKQYFAVVVNLAREDQISKITRAMGAARVDQLVHEAAQALRAALGPDRCAYQVGAAQFAFVSPSEVEQTSYLELLRTSFETMRATSSVRFVTNVTIGVRSFIAGSVSIDDIIRGATSAAQDARATEGAIALYSPASDIAHRRQYGLLQDFGTALEAGDQLRLVYQPRIDLPTGDCIGAEALLRWRHPLLGDVSPAEFIPIIEETSLAQATTQWVLETAMDQLSALQRGGLAITLSANISAANLGEVDLRERITTGLTRRALPFSCLEIELTESAIMDQPDQAQRMLQSLRDAGVCLAIDDFGTGHSSLAYLRSLPAQIVKIDQTFIRDLTTMTGPDFFLVETMIGLAHKLGYRVVAEGIETAEAAVILKNLGCEQAQGFWFARPMEADRFVTWLSERRRSARPAPCAA